MKRQSNPVQCDPNPIQSSANYATQTKPENPNDETKKTIVTRKETNKAAAKLLPCQSWRLPAHPVTPAQAAP
jgi:hypothetical protein